MGDNSKIEWTDATWNPVRGCSRVSEGCRNCYAERFAHRFSGKGQPYEGLTVLGNDGPRWSGKLMMVEEHLEDPLRWKRPRSIFVNSMSDLFHEDLDHHYIHKVFNVMQEAQHHRFQILTKRPERMYQFVEWWCMQHAESAETFKKVFHHVWFGVSCENQATADDRIHWLLATPAAVRWVSLEPLLGSIDLEAIYGGTRYFPKINALESREAGLPAKLDWVVVGGESGPGARPMNPSWVRSIRDACTEFEVPFFFKQWGEYMPLVYASPKERICKHCGCTERYACRHESCYWINRPGEEDVCSNCDGKPSRLHRFRTSVMLRVGKDAAGHTLDDREYQNFPEVKA